MMNFGPRTAMAKKWKNQSRNNLVQLFIQPQSPGKRGKFINIVVGQNPPGSYHHKLFRKNVKAT